MNTIRIKFLLLLCLILFLSACAPDNTAEEEISSEIPIKVESIALEKIIETIPGIGVFEAGTKLEIVTGGSGEIQSLKVRTGDVVQAGDVLFILDKEDQVISYNTVESQLRTIKDNLKIQYEDAKINLDQKQILFDNGAIAKKELDLAKSQLSQIEKQYFDSVNNYNNQVRNLSNSISDRTIRAPIAGLVATVYIQENQSVNNITALEIINDEKMIFKAMVTNESLDALKIGTKAYVYPDGDQNMQIEGEVIEYSELADAQSGLFEITVLLGDSDYSLRTGTYGEVAFIKDIREGFMIPKRAIIREGEDQFIFILDQDRAKKTKVETGVTKNDLVEIINSIEKDDLVITKGQHYLNDMDLVEVNGN